MRRSRRARCIRNTGRFVEGEYALQAGLQRDRPRQALKTGDRRRARFECDHDRSAGDGFAGVEFDIETAFKRTPDCGGAAAEPPCGAQAIGHVLNESLINRRGGDVVRRADDDDRVSIGPRQMRRVQGGGADADDLADLFELELDQLQNQYETVERGEREQANEQVDEP